MHNEGDKLHSYLQILTLLTKNCYYNLNPTPANWTDLIPETEVYYLRLLVVVTFFAEYGECRFQRSNNT
jgi:hypothetical protein